MSEETPRRSHIANESDSSSSAVGAPSGKAGQLWRALVALAAVPPSSFSSSSSSSRSPLKRKGEMGWVAGRSENLVVEFDEAYTSFVDSFESLPGESQLLTLQAMDTHLSSMVRAKNPELWTQKAHLADPHWVKVRFLAGDVIEAFGWPEGSETGVAGRLTLHAGEAE